MAGFRIRRHLVADAILKAKATDKGRAVITIDPLDGISVDGAFLLLQTIEKIRDKTEKEDYQRQVGPELKSLVEEVVGRTHFDSPRKRAYVLVIMRYYLFLREFTRTMEEFRKRPRIARPPLKRRAPPLVLTG